MFSNFISIEFFNKCGRKPKDTVLTLKAKTQTANDRRFLPFLRIALTLNKGN